MATYWMSIFMLLCFQCFSQTYNFNNGPIPADWQGDIVHFEIDTAKKLHLVAPPGQTSSSLVWTNTPYQNTTWEFYVGYAFAASKTNYALFYLESAEVDLTSTTNRAYYLKIGGASGSVDKIELIYQNGASKITVLESSIGLLGTSSVSCRIRVTKTLSGIWELYVDSLGGQNFTKEATGNHVSTDIFQYGGLRCVYSSTRRDKFYFDDILKKNLFAVSSYYFENDSTLNIFFSENLSNETMPALSTNIDIPYSLLIYDTYVRLRFDRLIPEGTYTTTLGSLFSFAGDSIQSTIITVVKAPIYYTGQVRITELMSDPSPSYGLPEVEWVELKNNSQTTIDLAYFSISDPASKIVLPHAVLPPDAVMVITITNGCAGMPLTNCIEVSVLPSLNNSSDTLFLWVNDTLLVDYMYYTLADLPNDYRADGGYSIVRQGEPVVCGFSNKLNFSEDIIGGSPGVVAGMPIEDEYSFNVRMSHSREIILSCEGMVDIDLLNIFSPILIDSITKHENKTATFFTINLQQAIEEGVMFQLQIDSINTCRIQKQHANYIFDIINPKTIAKDDVFINEVLYNPFSRGVDVIELYNTTDKYIQLQQTHFLNQSNGRSIQYISISNDCIIKPMSYVAFTSDTTTLKQHYNNTLTENCIQFKSFVTMDDAGGVLFFMGATSDTLDIVYYGDDYHNPLLRETEGVSLEKINPAVSSFFAQNWTSSAVNCTPGYANSQLFTSKTSIQKTFYCDPCHVTTNINGVADFVLLHLTETRPGFIVSIGIYTLFGEKVLDVVENHIVANQNSFMWNGQKSNGSLLEDGIYLAVAEWWSADGKSYRSKIPISTSQY